MLRNAAWCLATEVRITVECLLHVGSQHLGGCRPVHELEVRQLTVGQFQFGDLVGLESPAVEHQDELVIPGFVGTYPVDEEQTADRDGQVQLFAHSGSIAMVIVAVGVWNVAGAVGTVNAERVGPALR